MTPNPFLSLLHSRKFWLMILDLIVSFTTYFVTKYVGHPEDALFVIGGLQPVFVTIIGAIAYEDGKNAEAAALIGSIESVEDNTRVG